MTDKFSLHQILTAYMNNGLKRGVFTDTTDVKKYIQWLDSVNDKQITDATKETAIEFANKMVKNGGLHDLAEAHLFTNIITSFINLKIPQTEPVQSVDENVLTDGTDHN